MSSFYINAASWLYLAAILEKRQSGASQHGELTAVTMPPGLIGGTESILFYMAFLIWPGQLTWLFTLMASLVMVTIGQRLWWAAHNLTEGPTHASQALHDAASDVDRAHKKDLNHATLAPDAMPATRAEVAATPSILPHTPAGE